MKRGPRGRVPVPKPTQVHPDRREQLQEDAAKIDRKLDPCQSCGVGFYGFWDVPDEKGLCSLCRYRAELVRPWHG